MAWLIGSGLEIQDFLNNLRRYIHINIELAHVCQKVVLENYTVLKVHYRRVHLEKQDKALRFRRASIV